ncbi:hypothetical protein BDB01DRAFT_856288 [Pilobolus umbonatus]|nr:hypothetical protein BDB01DRAFT_856288 [Pilobolus umbonatus]
MSNPRPNQATVPDRELNAVREISSSDTLNLSNLSFAHDYSMFELWANTEVVNHSIYMGSGSDMDSPLSDTPVHEDIQSSTHSSSASESSDTSSSSYSNSVSSSSEEEDSEDDHDQSTTPEENINFLSGSISFQAFVDRCFSCNNLEDRLALGLNRLIPDSSAAFVVDAVIPMILLRWNQTSSL